MKKSTEDFDERRMEALRQEYPLSTEDRLEKLLHNYKKGRNGPTMKRVHRLFRKLGLE